MFQHTTSDLDRITEDAQSYFLFLEAPNCQNFEKFIGFNPTPQFYGSQRK